MTPRASKPKAPRKSDLCPYCGALDAQPPYRFLRDGIPSVTQLSSLIDGGKSSAFAFRASQIAANVAVHNPHRLDGLSTSPCDSEDKDKLCGACRLLRYEHKMVWDGKAAIGTHVHHLALSWGYGHDIEVDAVSEPYMDAVEAFYHAHRPHWIMAERTIENDVPGAEYRGKFDGIASLVACPACPVVDRDGNRPACRWLLDWKTGGFYPAEQALQLSAYRFATGVTTWDDNKKVVDRQSVPEVDHCGVILLGSDGSYTLCELPADVDAYTIFLSLRRVWAWNREIEKWKAEIDKPEKEAA